MQGVTVAERGLQIGDLAAVGQSFDRFDRCVLRLHRQHQARTNDLTIDAHRARATNLVLANDMCAGQFQMLPQEVSRLTRGSTCASTRSPFTSSEMRTVITQMLRMQIWTAQQRGHATREQYLRQMTAHGRSRLLILLGVELLAQRRRGIGQYFGRDGDVNELPGSSSKQRPIADGKETKAEIGELPAPDDRLSRQT